jgi:hypothetical protein
MLHLNIWLLQHGEIHGKRCSPWGPELVVLTLSLLKYMTTSIFVFGMTPRCCKVSAMYFMLGESPNEGPNDHIWLHNCQANLCMFLRFSNFLSERERERERERSWPAPKLWNQYHFEVRIINFGSIGGWRFGANLTLTF